MSQWKMARATIVQATTTPRTIQIGADVPSTEIAIVVWAAAGIVITIGAIWTYFVVKEKKARRKEKEDWKAQMKAVRDEVRQAQRAKRHR